MIKISSLYTCTALANINAMASKLTLNFKRTVEYFHTKWIQGRQFMIIHINLKVKYILRMVSLSLTNVKVCFKYKNNLPCLKSFNGNRSDDQFSAV